MPLRGRAALKSEVADFDHFAWWKALIKEGVSPSEAWGMDFIETTHVLDITPSRADITMALYHQRKQNGAPIEWLQQNH